MVLSLVILLVDVRCVVEMVVLGQIKVFLLCNKLVLNVLEQVKKLPTHVMIAMVKVINKLQKKYP